jgi:hypothetical protein
MEKEDTIVQLKSYIKKERISAIYSVIEHRFWLDLGAINLKELEKKEELRWQELAVVIADVLKRRYWVDWKYPTVRQLSKDLGYSAGSLYNRRLIVEHPGFPRIENLNVSLELGKMLLSIYANEWLFEKLVALVGIRIEESKIRKVLVAENPEEMIIDVVRRNLTKEDIQTHIESLKVIKTLCEEIKMR